MLKKNLFLINCWLIFIVLAAFGKMVGVYQEWTEAPPIVISFSTLENVSQNLKIASESFETRESRIKEDVVTFQRLTLENEMNKEEDKLAIKTKIALAKLKPLHQKFKIASVQKVAFKAKPKAKPVPVVVEEDDIVVVNTQKEVIKPVELNDAELFTINNEAPFEQGAIQAKFPHIIKTASLFVPVTESLNLKVAKVSNEESFEEDSLEGEAQAEVLAESSETPAQRLDRVQTDQAAVERKSSVNELKENVANSLTSEDEPIFLDYSKDEGLDAEPPMPTVAEALAQKLPEPGMNTQVVGGIPTKAKMSPAVERAISRELNSPQTNPKSIVLDDEGDDELQLSTQESKASLTRTPFAPEAAAKAVKTEVNTQGFKEDDKEEGEKHEAKLALSAIKVELNQGQGHSLNNFEFELGYDNSERLFDSGSGVVEYSIPLHSQAAVIDGRLVQKDSLRTRTSLSLGEGLLEMEVPTFSISSLEKFLEQEKLRGEGGFLLVDVQNEVFQTLIDADFEKSYFLNENFVKTNNASEARYHFYVGVEPGNVLITYQLKNKKTAQKVLFVGLDEMTFDAAEFAPERVRKLALYEQKLFGSELSDLQLSPEDLRYFNTSNTASLQGLNFYEINRPALPLGMREYFEVGTKRDAVFVGNLEAKSLKVPSLDFRDAVLDSQGLQNLEGACLIQLNLSKKLKDVRVMAEAGRRPMNLTQSYLGKNGEFSTEFDSTSTKAFFVGYEQGTVDYRLDYLDGSSDAFQGFCSLGSYIIEEL